MPKEQEQPAVDRPTCFVVMGFNKKTDFETGRTLDLDKSYKNIIKPAVEAAGLSCIRADEIVHSGLIDVPMYEQLLNADVVVADISTSNKNAFYELGVRHALRPFTTVVIAEDGIKSFPFDVNHVAVRQYHHLGDDIGYDEVMRFRELLTTAICEVMKKDPRAKDSPVYTFLNGLTPPAIVAAQAAQLAAETGGKSNRSAAGEPRSESREKVNVGRGGDTSAAVASTHSELMQQVDAAQKKGDFIKAKNLLSVIRDMISAQSSVSQETPYIIQRLALVTYKSEYPSETEALNEARDLLASLEPRTSNDTETLGLWGAVHKRLWERTQDTAMLDEAVRAYERGFYLRNDHYNGINFAYLLNVRAAGSADLADAIADFVQARRVRQEVLSICGEWLASNPQPPESSTSAEAMMEYNKARYWVLATAAEASLGLGDGSNTDGLNEAYSVAPESWMIESTKTQVEKLAPLLANSPLRQITG